MKRHMGKRILAIALAAVMMSSAIDYSCTMEVRAEESSTESVVADEVSEITDEGSGSADTDTKTESTDESADEITVVEEQEATPAMSSGASLTEEPETGVSTEEAEEETEEDIPEQEDAEEQLLTVEETAEIDPEILEDLDNDELFAGHVEQVLYGNDAISTYANYGESKFEGVNLSIYQQLKALAQTIANEGGTAVVTISGDLGITWVTSNTGEALREEAKEKFAETVQMNQVISALLVDCPYDMYWYDKTTGVNWAYSIYNTGSTAYVSNLTVRFTPAAAYQRTDPADGTNSYYIDPSKATAASTAATNARSIVAEYDSKSDYDKLDAYRAKICELVSYNHAAASSTYTDGYGDPWQLIYVFDNDTSTNVVCEGYSKAFQYLCDLSEFESEEITCYTVTGTMTSGSNGGGHMWNIVHMDDEENYLVDVTNCDGNTIGSPDKLFLVGATGTVLDGYSVSVGNTSIHYAYNDKMESLYDGTELVLSNTSYTVPTNKMHITDEMVVLEASSKEYDGQTTEPNDLLSVTYQDTALTEGTDYKITVTKEIKNAGSYEIKITGQGSYTGSVKKTYVVKKRTLTPSVDAGINKEYDGTVAVEAGNLAIHLDRVVAGEQISATAGSAVYQSANAASGIAVHITGITLSGDAADNYELSTSSLETTGTITPKNMAGVTIGSVPNQYYTGSELRPTLEVKDNGKSLRENVDYTVSYRNNIEVGSAQAIVAGMGNYGNTKAVSFEIIENRSSAPTTPAEPTTPTEPSAPEPPSVPAASSWQEQSVEEQAAEEQEPDTLDVTVENIKVQSYTGKGITPKITVKDPATRKKLKQGRQYTVSYENNVEAGTAAIVIRGIEASGYSGVKHVYFTIQPQNIAKKVKASVAGKKFLYTGQELTPGVNLTYNKMKLTEGVDYVVSYSNNVEKGSAQILITGIGNYTGSRTVKFKITGPKLKDAQVSLVQNGTLYPDITVTYAGKTRINGQDYTVIYPKTVKSGKNIIKVRGSGSFSGSVKLIYYVEEN